MVTRAVDPAAEGVGARAAGAEVDGLPAMPEVFDLAAFREALRAGEEAVRARHEAGAPGREVLELRTRLLDRLVERLFALAEAEFFAQHLPTRQRLALVAVGGYGRGEMSPGSDVDLMCLYPWKPSAYVQTVSERLFYALWDLGFTVGNAVRRLGEAVRLAQRDLTVRTALLDSRFLAGDRALYDEYLRVIRKEVLYKDVAAFVDEKLRELRQRHEKYGGSVYILEPNVKEGQGGLRDLHTALWIAKAKFKIEALKELKFKGVMTEQEYALVERAADFLWRIRNALHYRTGRKDDRLTFDHQEAIAAALGFRATRGALAVERFMRTYYLRAATLSEFADRVIAQARATRSRTRTLVGYLTQREVAPGFKLFGGELTVTSPALFAERPAAILEAFELAARLGVPMSARLEAAIREHRHRIDAAVRRDPEATASFRRLLALKRGVGTALRAMHRLHVLGAFIPEFGRLVCRMQHDVYHVYTVDEHLLKAVGQIRTLLKGDYTERFPLLSAIAEEIERPDLLILGVFLHDIGKGHGHGHVPRGARLAVRIGIRLGYPPEDVAVLEFLALHHLTMSHLAQRRDLNDEKLIHGFARTVGTLERLKMLYLLTFADMRAVGPEVWTPWKASLLQELYEKTAAVLREGRVAPGRPEERVAAALAAASRALAGEFDEATREAYFRTLPTRYVLITPAEEIAAHARVALRQGGRPLATSLTHRPDRGYSELVVSTLDVPGLFAKIAGVLAGHNVNILSAQIHTRKDGHALDVFQLTSTVGDVLDDPRRWERVLADLEAAIVGRLDVDELVARRRRPSILGARPRPRVATAIEIDNEASDEYTVIDVYTQDRVGLLYSITRTLASLGLTIATSKISTKGDKAEDVFYVTDVAGHKVTSPQRLEDIRAALEQAVAEP
ncbi:MAG TPA: [protein-PII] uridylyltransferase [Thermodesulfobacteriota bacterium]|nr:[protein-PII] uridylyltransferase [Thermodesulfobacteriota bacterium]